MDHSSIRESGSFPAPNALSSSGQQGNIDANGRIDRTITHTMTHHKHSEESQDNSAVALTLWKCTLFEVYMCAVCGMKIQLHLCASQGALPDLLISDPLESVFIATIHKCIFCLPEQGKASYKRASLKERAVKFSFNSLFSWVYVDNFLCFLFSRGNFSFPSSQLLSLHPSWHVFQIPAILELVRAGWSCAANTQGKLLFRSLHSSQVSGGDTDVSFFLPVNIFY